VKLNLKLKVQKDGEEEANKIFNQFAN